jgi:hypothetical protein
MITATFHVDYIREVRWNDWAYERIVFSEDSKDLLLTLVKNHGQMRDIGSDIIPGKGMSKSNLVVCNPLTLVRQRICGPFKWTSWDGENINGRSWYVVI